MLLASLVTGICLGIINADTLTNLSDVSLADIGIWRDNLYSLISTIMKTLRSRIQVQLRTSGWR